MTLDELIDIVDKHYDDGLINAYYDPEKQQARDDLDLDNQLAQFIVMEICDTFEEGAADPDQLREAVRVLEVAQDQLNSIIRGLDDHLP